MVDLLRTLLSLQYDLELAQAMTCDARAAENRIQLAVRTHPEFQLSAMVIDELRMLYKRIIDADVRMALEHRARAADILIEMREKIGFGSTSIDTPFPVTDPPKEKP